MRLMIPWTMPTIPIEGLINRGKADMTEIHWGIRSSYNVPRANPKHHAQYQRTVKQNNGTGETAAIMPVTYGLFFIYDSSLCWLGDRATNPT